MSGMKEIWTGEGKTGYVESDEPATDEARTRFGFA
jgi:hypothetical protein